MICKNCEAEYDHIIFNKCPFCGSKKTKIIYNINKIDKLKNIKKSLKINIIIEPEEINQLEFLFTNYFTETNDCWMWYYEYHRKLTQNQRYEKKYIPKLEEEIERKAKEELINIGANNVNHCNECGRLFMYIYYGGAYRKFCPECKPLYWKRYTKTGWISYQIESNRYTYIV